MLKTERLRRKLFRVRFGTRAFLSMNIEFRESAGYDESPRAE